MKIVPPSHTRTGWMGDPMRGASLGRSSSPEDQKPSGSVYLRQVDVDQDGYDRGGAYWGRYDIFEAWDGNGWVSFVEAPDRMQAAQDLRDSYGPMKFKVEPK